MTVLKQDIDSRAGENPTSKVSRARLFAALPRYSSTAIALRNRAFRSAPMIVATRSLICWFMCAIRLTPDSYLWRLCTAR